jgi:hypothetical protein
VRFARATLLGAAILLAAPAAFADDPRPSRSHSRGHTHRHHHHGRSRKSDATDRWLGLSLGSFGRTVAGTVDVGFTWKGIPFSVSVPFRWTPKRAPERPRFPATHSERFLSAPRGYVPMPDAVAPPERAVVSAAVPAAVERPAVVHPAVPVSLVRTDVLAADSVPAAAPATAATPVRTWVPARDTSYERTILEPAVYEDRFVPVLVGGCEIGKRLERVCVRPARTRVERVAATVPGHWE